MKRVQIIAGGIVQGVCFRFYAKRRADERGVAGWVRNLPDGRIEAVFEGEDGDVDDVVNWFRHGPPGAVVRDVAVDRLPFTGEDDNFRIVF